MQGENFQGCNNRHKIALTGMQQGCGHNKMTDLHRVAADHRQQETLRLFLAAQDQYPVQPVDYSQAVRRPCPLGHQGFAHRISC